MSNRQIVFFLQNLNTSTFLDSMKSIKYAHLIIVNKPAQSKSESDQTYFPVDSRQKATLYIPSLLNLQTTKKEEQTSERSARWMKSY